MDAGTAQAVAEQARHATGALDMPGLLALAAGLGWASGFRLYAVVFLVGEWALLAGWRCRRGFVSCSTRPCSW